MDALNTWESNWANIALDSTGGSFATNIASFIAARVNGKLGIAPPNSGTAVFTFNSSVFASSIASLKPTQTPASNLNQIASAWQSAILASTFIVSSGAYIGSPSPATLFAAPPAATPIPSAGMAALSAELNIGFNTPTASASVFPIAFYNAFAALQFSLTGMNSLVPTPTPLVATIGVL
jgi:hypothetical protein